MITIAPAITSATAGSTHFQPGPVHEREADEHAERRVGVGAQVRGVALQRRRTPSRAARRNSQPDTSRFTIEAKPMTAMPNPSDSSSVPSTSAFADA